MRICFVASEFFAYGAYGGYGRLVRTLCKGLAARGIETYALIRRCTPEAVADQPEVEMIDETRVIALPKGYFGRCRRRDLFRMPAADLYISMDPRFDSWLAMRANPASKHAILFGDPYPFREKWAIMAQDPANRSFLKKWITWAQFEGLQIFARRAVHGADGLFAHGLTVADRAAALYGLPKPPGFLPNPIDIPEGPIEKAAQPTVLFLARWDLQKRPEIFFALARKFPEARFVGAGAATDPARDAELRAQFAGIPNVVMPGRIVGEEKDRWLRESWILINTSIREGMPLSYQEALSYGCALLAPINADRLPEQFGHHVEGEAYQAGLHGLIEGDRWRTLGEAGREYMTRVHGFENAIEANLRAYQDLIDS